MLVILVVRITYNQSYTNVDTHNRTIMHNETQTENNLQSKIEDAKQMVADGIPVSVVLKMMGLRFVDLGL